MSGRPLPQLLLCWLGLPGRGQIQRRHLRGQVYRVAVFVGQVGVQDLFRQLHQALLLGVPIGIDGVIGPGYIDGVLQVGQVLSVPDGHAGVSPSVEVELDRPVVPRIFPCPVDVQDASLGPSQQGPASSGDAAGKIRYSLLVRPEREGVPRCGMGPQTVHGSCAGPGGKGLDHDFVEVIGNVSGPDGDQAVHGPGDLIDPEGLAVFPVVVDGVKDHPFSDIRKVDAIHRVDHLQLICSVALLSDPAGDCICHPAKAVGGKGRGVHRKENRFHARHHLGVISTRVIPLPRTSPVSPGGRRGKSSLGSSIRPLQLTAPM